MPGKKSVLIVDDSALMRKMLTQIFEASGKLTVLGAAPDPFIARQMIKDLNPDVVTLDIEMPRMDGLEFLSKIMTLRPMPVVMISSLSQHNAEATLTALELGAVDYFGKPTQNVGESLSENAREISDIVYQAAQVQVRPVSKKVSAATNLSFSTTEQIIGIGASTGGVTAIMDVLKKLPSNAPAIVITQHMPGSFTTGFAKRLNDGTNLNVSEAKEGQRLLTGHAYVAPGDVHLGVRRSGGYYYCVLDDGPSVSSHKPSVDFLFSSLARTAGDRAIGVILTGMGKDGAKGLLEMREAGAVTIGQDKASATVYGMCGAAYEMGAVEHQCTLATIPAKIMSGCEDILKRKKRS